MKRQSAKRQTKKIKIALIAGARPNFMKIAPLMREFKNYPKIRLILIHTRQHYDENLSKVFFREFHIPHPDIYLNIKSGTHAEQTAKGLLALEKVFLQEKPDLVIVVGDVNSTLVGALTAKKLKIPVAHVEAGLRSFNHEMPEEINRIVTDHISDLLFVSEPSGVTHLLSEGIAREKIFFVGNIMIDTLFHNRAIAHKKSKILNHLNLESKTYIALTLHRAENVDSRENLAKIVNILEDLAKRTKIVWPIHPRTQAKLKQLKFYSKVKAIPHLKVIKPLGYFDFLKLMSHSKLILTDSGGIQEETTALGVPCLTLRKETERPITVEEGTNTVVGLDKSKIIKAFKKTHKQTEFSLPELWDGKTSKRITKTILKKFNR